MITKKYSRTTIQCFIEEKIAPETKLRDYDVLKDHERGMSYEQIAIRHHITSRTAFNIVKAYKK